MITYGTTEQQLPTCGDHTQNGHDNPDAVYSGRGPFTPADTL